MASRSPSASRSYSPPTTLPYTNGPEAGATNVYPVEPMNPNSYSAWHSSLSGIPFSDASSRYSASQRRAPSTPSSPLARPPSRFSTLSTPSPHSPSQITSNTYRAFFYPEMATPFCDRSVRPPSRFSQASTASSTSDHSRLERLAQRALFSLSDMTEENEDEGPLPVPASYSVFQAESAHREVASLLSGESPQSPRTRTSSQSSRRSAYFPDAK